jgi:16S rRNA (uracil1498-N3)-methyltransferase
MRLTRVFVDGELSPGNIMELERNTASHLAKVLRARSGDELVLFNGDGREFDASIESVRGSRVSASIDAARSVDRESPLKVTLLQCVPRGDRMDFVVQKATELGVERIVPVLSQRSVVRLDAAQAASKQAHWRAVAVSACEQCGRNRLPQVEAPQPLLNYLGAMAPQKASGALRLILEPAGAIQERSARSIDVAAGGPISQAEIAIGPEGGFSPEELDAFQLSAFARLGLGPRVLRTETAAIAAIVMLQTRFGDMCANPNDSSRTADS